MEGFGATHLHLLLVLALLGVLNGHASGESNVFCTAETLAEVVNGTGDITEFDLTKASTYEVHKKALFRCVQDLPTSHGYFEVECIGDDKWSKPSRHCNEGIKVDSGSAFGMIIFGITAFLSIFVMFYVSFTDVGKADCEEEKKEEADPADGAPDGQAAGGGGGLQLEPRDISHSRITTHTTGEHVAHTLAEEEEDINLQMKESDPAPAPAPPAPAPEPAQPEAKPEADEADLRQGSVLHFEEEEGELPAVST